MTDSPEGIATRARAEALAALGESGFTMDGLSEVFVQSGFFKDVKAKSQAIVKILLGREIGLKPLAAMLAINMVQGKPEVAAATLGALIKRSGKYDYRITEHTVDACTIKFYVVGNPSGSAGMDEIGDSRFTMDDAKRAGLAEKDNYRHYPRNMMFARAMSNGVKWYCLDAIGSVPVYVEGEVPEPMNTPEDFPELEPREIVQVAGTEQDTTLTSTSRSGDQPPASELPVNGKESAMAVEDPVQSFDINGVNYQTKGITREQMLMLFGLCSSANKKIGRKGYDKELLKAEFGLTSKLDLTEELAERYTIRLKEVIDA